MSRYLERLFGLEGKVAAIIGGGGHLLSAMAVGMARAGAAVMVLDKDPEAARSVADTISDAGFRAAHGAVDATDRDSLEVALAATVKRLEGAHILINGAGANAPTPFLEIGLDEWRTILDAHATATFLACQVFGAHMVEQGAGSIINMSSASAGPPLSKAFAYSAAKAAVHNLTQNLAREWGPAGVRVNALRPGFFPTEWSIANFIDAEREAAILGHTPMGRYGAPEELVGAVVWLASDAASFVTGAHITVDGGFTAMSI